VEEGRKGGTSSFSSLYFGFDAVWHHAAKKKKGEKGGGKGQRLCPSFFFLCILGHRALEHAPSTSWRGENKKKKKERKEKNLRFMIHDDFSRDEGLALP